MHDLAPVTYSGSDETRIFTQDVQNKAEGVRQQQRLLLKWAGLWRAIILSCLGKTSFPYSRYIRTLNLEDLKQLLEDLISKDAVSK